MCVQMLQVPVSFINNKGYKKKKKKKNKGSSEVKFYWQSWKLWK